MTEPVPIFHSDPLISNSIALYSITLPPLCKAEYSILPNLGLIPVRQHPDLNLPIVPLDTGLNTFYPDNATS